MSKCIVLNAEGCHTTEIAKVSLGHQGHKNKKINRLRRKDINSETVTLIERITLAGGTLLHTKES